MGMPIDVFFPIAGGSVQASAGASSVATALPGGGAGEMDEDLRIYNAGVADVFLAFGAADATAAADGTSMILPAGNTEAFRIRRGTTHVAHIARGGGSATLFITRGIGA